RGQGGWVRVGLQSVAGFSAACLDRLLAARRQGRFTTAADCWHRTRPADDEARALIHAGALDSLDAGGNRTTLLWQWAVFMRRREMAAAASLFPPVLPEPPILPPPDRLTLLRREFAVLGFLCSEHPVTLIGRLPSGLVKVARLGDHVGRRVRCAVWLLTGKLVSTRSGEAMEFLTFEDETGIVEATFFPLVYRRYAHLLQSGRAYVLAGAVDQDYGAITLTVEQAAPLGISG
ncbi:DNA polymerase III subunit alpha, partial [Desulfoprunum benzoelyticum]